MSLDEYNDKLNFLAACTAVNVQQQRSKPWLHFLSCLYGSERVATIGLIDHRFLSCLYGSEQARSRGSGAKGFLSCLYGSELAPKTYNHLKEKEIPSFSCQKPSFFEVS
ncbi:TPA: GNAT family N-acetyltransferase [Pseudomonas aeruginosa]|nr:GNAT family N-acetyltransferase [Pseudomonas aeruginosa]